MKVSLWFIKENKRPFLNLFNQSSQYQQDDLMSRTEGLEGLKHFIELLLF